MVAKSKAPYISACLLILLACTNIPAATVRRVVSRSLQQSGEGANPDLHRDSLLNGLQLIMLNRSGTGKVTVHLRINSGAMFDLANKGGLADITAGMLLRGGPGLSAKNVADLTAQLGLTINISVGWDSTDIVINGPSQEFDSIMDLLTRLVLKPAFDRKQLDSLKEARVSEMLAQKNSADKVATGLATELLFGNYPFGHPTEGTPDSVARISRDDVAYYHDRFYIPNNSELLVEGDVSSEEVTREARTRLGIWEKGSVVPPTFVPPAALSGHKIAISDSHGSNCTAVLAQIGSSRRAEDYYADLIASKLVPILATSASKVAGVRYESFLDARYLPGPFLIRISAPPENLAASIQGAVAAMVAVMQGSATDEQINTVKGDIISSFRASMNSSAGESELLLEIEQYGLGRDYLMNFEDRVNAVSADEIAAAARKHFSPGALAIGVIGPAAQIRPSLAKLGALSLAR